MTPTIAVATRGLWYLTRGTGAVTLVLLTISVVLGITEALRVSAPPRWPRFVIDAVHRNVSLLVLVALAIHVLLSVIDTFAPINLIDAFIPFISRYRPLWLGLGALASDILIAVVITSLLRARIGFRTWRVVHWCAYACWPIALVHGLGTGTDTKSSWMLVLSAVCAGAVLSAIAWRAVRSLGIQPGWRTVVLGTTVAGPIALVVWLVNGPLAPGWARRAGTPPSVLAAVGASPSVPAARSQTPAPTALRAPFSAQLSGTLSQSQTDAGLTRLDIATTLSGGATGRFNVTISGQPDANGGVSMTSSQVALGPASAPQLYHGRITSLSGSRFIAEASAASGNKLELRADLQIDPQGNVTGTLDATSGGGGQ